jgi:hypothetical protein
MAPDTNRKKDSAPANSRKRPASSPLESNRPAPARYDKGRLPAQPCPSDLQCPVFEDIKLICDFYAEHLSRTDPVESLIFNAQSLLNGNDTIPISSYFLNQHSSKKTATSLKKPARGAFGTVDFYRLVHGLSLVREYSENGYSEEKLALLIGQLKTLQHFTRALTHDDVDFNLQNVIIGTDVKSFPIIPILQQAKVKGFDKVLTDYFINVGLYSKQREAFFHAFTSSHLLTLVHYPAASVNGLIDLDSVFATAGAILGKHVLLCANSNDEESQIMGALMTEKQRLRKIDANLEDCYDIIYFSDDLQMTQSFSKQQIRQDGRPISALGFFEIWFHILAKFKSDAQAKDQKGIGRVRYQDALNWLGWWTTVQNGSILRSKTKERYIRLACSTLERIFKEATKPIIVLSARQNACQLREWGLKFDILIGANWSQCSEIDALAPLCLEPKKVIITGREPTFPPIIASANKNEFCQWSGFPFFKRMTLLYEDKTIMMALGDSGGPHTKEVSRRELLQSDLDAIQIENAALTVLTRRHYGIDEQQKLVEKASGNKTRADKSFQSDNTVAESPIGESQENGKLEQPSMDAAREAALEVDPSSARMRDEVRDPKGEQQVLLRHYPNPLLDKLSQVWGLDNDQKMG